MEAFDWLKPSPLWQTDGLDFRRSDFFQPQLLEFRSDTFMEDFLKAADSPQPRHLQTAVAMPPESDKPLKLFQPVHGCFYLVCSSLCCRLPGFPDREVKTGDGENVFFVLRKMIGGVEYAWVVNQTQKGWQALNGNARSVLKDEERQPLLNAHAGDGRSLLFGYLTVASRETYAAAPSEIATDPPHDRCLDELDARFTEPLSALAAAVGQPTPAISLTLSVYMLLDLWEFLFTYLPDVALALRDNPAASFSGPKAQDEAGLMSFLKQQQLGGTLTLAAALGKVANNRDALNATGGGDLPQLGFDSNYNLIGVGLNTDQLRQSVGKALPDQQASVELPKFDPQSDTQYVLRCVYERPQCDPPVAVVSQPSAPFQLAPFFDPEAPVRPVQIPLPADVSIAGLRKFKKGVSFMLSDAMRRKVASITGHEKSLIKDDTPSLGAGDTDGLAHICSFSIQIIFIVAFFLLLMFVIILNFVFWWIAFFRICLPIPKRLIPS